VIVGVGCDNGSVPTRYDVSNVPPQGGYIAKQCPVRAQLDILRPVEPRPTSAVLQRRFDRGIEFEAEIVAMLLAEHPGAVTIEGKDSDLRERATAEAMAAGAPLILNARLPSDAAGRRVGKPDLLILAPDGGYRPVDIKHHRTLEPGSEAARSSLLSEPELESATEDADGAARRNRGDLLQLAHYQRMLEAAGLAPGDGRSGGIIGVERRVVWYDLDAPVWRTPSSTGKQKMRSTMEVYDFEFDFRLDVMAMAMRHLQDPSSELIVIPFRKSECDECPWWDRCRPQLETGSGHPSLIPRMTWDQWEIHSDRGVSDRAAIATLDPLTARLISAGVDLAPVITEARQVPADTPTSALSILARRPKQRATLEAEGLVTAAMITELDARTASYSGTGLSALAEQIDRARAALGSEPVYLKRGIEHIDVPRADVEVDVDMENVEDGVYLWGALAGDEYRPFATWEPLTPESEAALFTRFWQWLMGVRTEALARGKTFRAYCWHEQAENSQMRRIGVNAGLLEEVERFITSDEWIDLRRVFDAHLITGGGSGLKLIAPITGFSWPVDDPGGGESMVRYDFAAGGDEQARNWLLDYNRGDVEATRAIREWMSDSRAIPSIDDALDHASLNR
jgi:predicted RecB family nuclease